MLVCPHNKYHRKYISKYPACNRFSNSQVILGTVERFFSCFSGIDKARYKSVMFIGYPPGMYQGYWQSQQATRCMQPGGNPPTHSMHYYQPQVAQPGEI